MIDAEGPAAEQLVDGAVGDLLEAIVDVQRWSDQHDHPVAEWSKTPISGVCQKD